MANKLSEKQIENRLIKDVKSLGGLCPKFVSPGFDGVPDRLILLPGGKIAFAELKAAGQKLRPQQFRRKQQFERLGFKVYVIDDIKQIGGVLGEIHTP